MLRASRVAATAARTSRDRSREQDLTPPSILVGGVRSVVVLGNLLLATYAILAPATRDLRPPVTIGDPAQETVSAHRISRP